MSNSVISWEYELNAFGKGKIVCGVDEAGRGPLAGRVYAAAVILDIKDKQHPAILMLNDSKKLTEKKRFLLYPQIKEIAKSWCIAYSEVDEIEEHNILSASLHAMRRAIDGLGFDRNLSDDSLYEYGISALGGQKLMPDAALIDGNVNKGFTLESKAVVGGDGLCVSIAAASILAKCERDLYCVNVLDKLYPEYAFAIHKGYGTKAHYKAVDEYGLCPLHRKSFFRKYYEKKNQ